MNYYIKVVIYQPFISNNIDRLFFYLHSVTCFKMSILYTALVQKNPFSVHFRFPFHFSNTHTDSATVQQHDEEKAMTW